VLAGCGAVPIRHRTSTAWVTWHRTPHLLNAASGAAVHAGNARKAAQQRSGKHLKSERAPLVSIDFQDENHLKINKDKRI